MLKEYLANLPKRIDELKRQLKPLEDGTMQIGSKRWGASEWVDETPNQIAQIKEEIIVYQQIIAEYRKKGMFDA